MDSPLIFIGIPMLIFPQFLPQFAAHCKGVQGERMLAGIRHQYQFRPSLRTWCLSTAGVVTEPRVPDRASRMLVTGNGREPEAVMRALGR